VAADEVVRLRRGPLSRCGSAVPAWWWVHTRLLLDARCSVCAVRPGVLAWVPCLRCGPLGLDVAGWLPAWPV